MGSDRLGSRVWANNVLRIVARKCAQATPDTAIQGLRALCLTSVRSLQDYGYYWQADRVRNHFNRYLQRMKSVDLMDQEGSH